MADNTIDTLQLEIKSNSDQATKALDNLAKTLYSLNKSFKSTNSGGMRNFAREVGRVSVSIKALSGLKLNTNTISGISKEFQKLGKNLTDIDTNKIQSTSNAIEKVSESLSLLNGLNLKDSKINLTLGALKRLAGVDMSKFDSSGISGIIASISELSRVPEVSSGVNRFVSSLQKLVNAGDKSSVVTAQLPALGDSLKKVVDKISKAEKISEPINMFVQSLGRLANAGNKTGQTAGQLKNLSDEILKFFNAMQEAPDISEKTIRMTEALARLSSSGGKISGVSNTLPKYFNNITKVGKNAEKSIKKISSGISNAFSHIGYSSNGLKKASLNLGMLLKTALGFSAIRGLWNFAKTSVKLGSDVAEIQNVVDVAFGNMAGMVDEFAKTATEKFGLSELAAKQYSGTMMAMLKSSGVMKESAAEMSTTLAGLAGDIASFYNIDTDEAFRKIRSGIAGEIEPLRQLGISMTVANLEAFALSQGITKSYQAMSQAEQVMLRYNYLMWASADAQGDFARTSGNFANQVRLLKLNIQQLGATLGQGLIAAIQPAIQALNKLMSILIKAANAFKVFMYTLMGKKVKGSAGGIVQDISGIGDAGDVAAGGLGDATESADKLKKKLSVLPFDQLNQLIDNSNQSSSGGSGSGIGGGIGSGDFDTGLDEILSDDKEGEISEWAKRIRKAFLAEDWEKLGYEIADGLNSGLQKVYDVISWKNVGPKITAFTNAFTRTFNSLVDNFDWELLGKTVGEGVNTVVRTLTQLIEGIKWVKLGEKISLGIRGAIKKIKWDELGNLLGDWFMVSWDIFYGIAKDFPYAELGKSIGIGLKNAIKSINFQTITDTFVNLFNGIFGFLKNFNAEKPFEGLGEKISTAINNSLWKLDVKTAGESLGDFAISLLDELISMVQGVDWNLFGQKVGELLGSIDWTTILYKVVKLIVSTLSEVLRGMEVSGFVGSVTAWIARGLLLVKVASPVLSLVRKISSAITGTESANIMKIAFKKLLSTATVNLPSALGNLGTSLNTIASLMSKLGKSSIWTAGMFDLFKNRVNLLQIEADASDYSSLASSLLMLKDDGKLTATSFNELYGELVNAQRAKVPFEDALVYVREALNKSGVASKDFEKALNKSLDKLGVDAPKKSRYIGIAIGEGTSEGINNSTEKVRNANKSLIDKIKEWWTGSSGFDIHSPSRYMFSIGTNIISGLYNGTNSSKPSLLYLFAQIPNQMKNQFSGIGKIFNSKGREVVSGLKTGYSSNIYSFLSYLSSQPQTMSGKLSGVKSLFNQRGLEMVSGVRDGWQHNSSGIYKMFNGVPKNIANSLGGMYGIGRNAITNFRNGFQSVHIPMPRFSVSSTRYSWGSSSFSVPKFNLKWYKKGGLFDMPSVIGVGEAGKEAVLPLENKRTMSMIADSIMSNSTVGMDEEVLTNAVARGFAMAMMNNQQSPVNVTCYAELRTEDNEVLARAVTKGQQSIDYRKNPTPQFGY